MATRAERKKLQRERTVERQLRRERFATPKPPQVPEEWQGVADDPGGLDPSEYKPLGYLLDTPEITKMHTHIDETFKRVQVRVAKRVEKVLVKATRASRKALTEELTSKVIDEVAIFYEDVEEVPAGMVRVIPMMQLFSRAPLIIHAVHGHPNYSDLSRVERNEFVSALICEKSNATLFSVKDETTYTPALVAIIETEDTKACLKERVKRYPNRTKEEQKILNAIIALKPELVFRRPKKRR